MNVKDRREGKESKGKDEEKDIRWKIIRKKK